MNKGTQQKFEPIVKKIKALAAMHFVLLIVVASFFIYVVYQLDEELVNWNMNEGKPITATLLTLAALVSGQLWFRNRIQAARQSSSIEKKADLYTQGQALRTIILAAVALLTIYLAKTTGNSIIFLQAALLVSILLTSLPRKSLIARTLGIKFK